MGHAPGSIPVHLTGILLFFIAAALFAGCGVSHPIRPVPEGKTEFIASLGGPIIPVGSIAFPVPYLNIGLQHGLKPNLSIFGNLHGTALLFKNVAFDGGIATRILPEKDLRPELTFIGRGYFFWDAFRGRTVRFYPMGTLTASYASGERSLIYFGADNLYQFSTSEVFLSPFVGYSFPLGNSMLMQCEAKWMAMNKDTRHGVFEGVAAIGGKGNVGLFIGFQWEAE